MPLPETSTVDAVNSSCASDSAVLALSFDVQNYAKQTFSLVNGSYSLSALEIGLLHDQPHFPDSNQTGRSYLYYFLISRMTVTSLRPPYDTCCKTH